MARRRQEIALQTEIETQEEWNETINKEGLTGILFDNCYSFFVSRSNRLV